MNEIMLKLGAFAFSISTAAYQEFKRSSSWKWAAIERIGTDDALQFTGRGEDSITLEGTIIPHFRAGTSQIDRMRQQADAGTPMQLVSGRGDFLGLWVVLSVDEGQDVHYRDGTPRRQQFTIRIRYYGQ